MVARRWSYRRRSAGGPQTASEIRRLVLRPAEETWEEANPVEAVIMPSTISVWSRASSSAVTADVEVTWVGTLGGQSRPVEGYLPSTTAPESATTEDERWQVPAA